MTVMDRDGEDKGRMKTDGNEGDEENEKDDARI